MRLVTALAMEQSEEWEASPRRYVDIDKLEDWGIERGMSAHRRVPSTGHSMIL